MSWEGPGFVDRHTRLLWDAAGRPERPLTVHDGLRGDVERALHDARRRGLCEVHEVAVRDPAFREALLAVRARLDELPARVRLLVDPDIGEARRVPRTGDPWLDVAGVFVRADPAGVALVDGDTLARRLDEWAQAGWRLAVEARAPTTVAAALDAFAVLYGADCGAAAPELHLPDDVDDEAARRATELGVVLVLDPGAERPDAERWDALLTGDARVACRAPSPLDALQALAVRELGVDPALAVLADRAAGTVVLGEDPHEVPEDELARLDVVDARPSAS